MSAERVVLEHAGRPAGFVAHDLAARHVLHIVADFGGPHRRRVGQRHVAVEPIDPDRVVGRHGVDPIARRQLAAPQRVVPIAAGDPRAAAACFLANSPMRRTNSSRVRGVAKLHGRQAQAAVDEMDVRIDEAGHDEAVAGVDDAASCRRDSVRSSSREPTATILSSRIATASAQGRCASAVQMRPSIRIVAGESSAASRGCELPSSQRNDAEFSVVEYATHRLSVRIGRSA